MNRAKKKGIEFSLEMEWVLARVEAGCCELTNATFDLSPPKNGKKCNPYSPSIDRIDSSKGYTKKNCRVVCTWVNMALNEHGTEVFKTFALKFLQQASPELFVLPKKKRARKKQPAQYELNVEHATYH